VKTAVKGLSVVAFVSGLVWSSSHRTTVERLWTTVLSQVRFGAIHSFVARS
jgi:hypothetical protein